MNTPELIATLNKMTDHVDDPMKKMSMMLDIMTAINSKLDNIDVKKTIKKTTK